MRAPLKYKTCPPTSHYLFLHLVFLEISVPVSLKPYIGIFLMCLSTFLLETLLSLNSLRYFLHAT